jgi:uncharacterized protein (TIGR02996 family)
MTTERAAFLDAIRTNPDDDTARLVYADFLQEHGEGDRAEFIRWQVARFHDLSDGPLDRFVEWPRDGGVWPYDDWPDSATAIFGPHLPRVTFRWRRGFIDSVGLPVAVFTRNAKSLFARHPVTDVSLHDVRPELHPAHVEPDAAEPDGKPHILVGVDTEQDTLFGCRVPMPVWYRLVGLIEEDAEPDVWPHKTFATLAHARTALSAACVHWGRSLHGLPALPARSVG